MMSSKSQEKGFDLGMKMLEDDKYADVKVTCQDFTFYVHRSILSATSTYFRAALGKEFKEGKTGAIDLSCETPGAVARLILFLYTHCYPDFRRRDAVTLLELERNSRWLDSMQRTVICGKLFWDMSEDLHGIYLHSQMYVVGDKYLSSDLKDYSRNCLITVLREQMTYGLSRFEEGLQSTLYSAARLVYCEVPDTSENRQFREMLVCCVQKRNFERPQTRVLLQEAMLEIPDFAVDLVTKGCARQYVYCTACQNIVALSKLKCYCGLTGLCARDEACKSVGLSKRIGDVKCWDCDTTGCVFWTEPKDLATGTE